MFPSVAVLLAFLAVLQVQSLEIPPELGKAFKEAHDLCVKENGADEDNLRGCKQKHIPDQASSMCYLDCMIKHVKVTLEDAVIHVQNIPHELTDQWHEMMTTARGVCGKEEHNGDCYYAWDKINCFMKNHEGFLDICDLLLF